MITIFAEKPDMARRIASAMSTRITKQQHHIDVEYNGEKYCVTWGYGHLCELCEVKDYTSDYKWNTTNYPFYPDEFKLKLRSSTFNPTHSLTRIPVVRNSERIALSLTLNF